MLRLALVTVLFMALMVSPAIAKKAPVERTVVDGVTLAKVKPGTQLQPYYPATARTTNHRAEVVVSLQVLENGKVGEVEVLDASVSDLGFEQSAADAVKQWRFHPALEDGRPIETVTLVRLTFDPPTLKSPEGFVYAETSPRNYAVGFLNGFMDQSWTKAFGNSTASHHTNRDRMKAAELPDCPPDRRKNCIYDKALLAQFGGSGSGIAQLPHVTPPPDSTGGR
jgi:TonB family protein